MGPDKPGAPAGPGGPDGPGGPGMATVSEPTRNQTRGTNTGYASQETVCFVRVSLVQQVLLFLLGATILPGSPGSPERQSYIRLQALYRHFWSPEDEP